MPICPSCISCCRLSWPAMAACCSPLIGRPASMLGGMLPCAICISICCWTWAWEDGAALASGPSIPPAIMSGIGWLERLAAAWCCSPQSEGGLEVPLRRWSLIACSTFFWICNAMASGIPGGRRPAASAARMCARASAISWSSASASRTSPEPGRPRPAPSEGACGPRAIPTPAVSETRLGLRLLGADLGLTAPLPAFSCLDASGLRSMVGEPSSILSSVISCASAAISASSWMASRCLPPPTEVALPPSPAEPSPEPVLSNSPGTFSRPILFRCLPK
mmetsp:Transcript_2863/g.8020  ORF Transcript_2863/g.8020 Transcript_2863/m.8020 type:complete len:278 (-) Transcript_2863:5024-5857(-)